MKAVNYHVALPYPAINGIEPDAKLAKLLAEGYCGRVSEMTTVSQYAHHHLNCLENEEISRTLKGIFLIETHHLELLGRCLVQLGQDPKYILNQRGGKSFWHAGYVDYQNNIKDILLADIDGEKRAIEYYLRTAGTVDSEKIAILMLRLAEDEKLHLKMFSDLYKKYCP